MNKLKVEYVDIRKIKPFKRNAKLHPQEQVEQIKKSIQDYGMCDPIAVWKDEIVEGHGRLLALKELNYENVPIIRLDHLTDEQRRAYMLVHNKTTMNSGFDLELLGLELADLPDFDAEFYGFDADLPEDEENIVEDEVPDLPEEPKAKAGQIWLLGNHRLMCGDSTDIVQVAKLCNGHVMDLLFTNPPYNVNVQNSEGMKIENDNMSDSDFKEFLNSAFENAEKMLKKGGAFYIWYADSEDLNFRNACKNNGLDIKQCLIWVKNGFNFGRQDYKWKHEPCLYGWKEGAAHYFVEEYNHPTVIEDEIDIDKMKKEDMKKLLKEIFESDIPLTTIHENKPLKNDLHPTMKPLKMCADLIKNSTRRGEKVLDLFGGSGSTLMTCEQLGRTCFMMEYDPKYADVIIERWEKFTGQKAVLLNEEAE